MPPVDNKIYTLVCEQVLRAHILCKSMERFDEFSLIKVNLSQPLYNTLDHSCSVVVQFIRYASFRPNKHQTYFTLHETCSREEPKKCNYNEQACANNKINSVYDVDTVHRKTHNYTRINVGCAFIVTFWLENTQLLHCWRPYMHDQDGSKKGSMSYVSFDDYTLKDNTKQLDEINVLFIKREIAERLIEWLMRSRTTQFVIPGLQSVSSSFTTDCAESRSNLLSSYGTTENMITRSKNNKKEKKKKDQKKICNMSVNENNRPTGYTVAHKHDHKDNKDNSKSRHIESSTNSNKVESKHKTRTMTLLSNEQGWVTEFLSDFVYMLRAWRFLETDIYSVEYNKMLTFSDITTSITSLSLAKKKARAKVLKTSLLSQNTHDIKESETKCLYSSYLPMTKMLHYSLPESQGADKLMSDNTISKINNDEFVAKDFVDTKINLSKANRAMYSVEMENKVAPTAKESSIEHVTESDQLACPPFAALFLPDGRVACFQNSEMLNTNTTTTTTTRTHTRTNDFCVWVTSHGAHVTKSKQKITSTNLSHNTKANLETYHHPHHKESSKEQEQMLTHEELEENEQLENINDKIHSEGVEEEKENEQIFVDEGSSVYNVDKNTITQEVYTKNEHSPSVHLNSERRSHTHSHLLPSLLNIQQFLGVEACYSWDDFVLYSSSSSYESTMNVIREADGGVGSTTTEQMLQDNWMMKTRHILLHNAQMCNSFALHQIKRLFVAIAHATEELHKRHMLSLPHASPEMQLPLSHVNKHLNVTGDLKNEFQCKDVMFAAEVYLRVSFVPIFISTLRVLWNEQRQPFWAGTLLCCLLLPLLLIQSPILSIILHELQHKLGKEYGKCITVVRHVERVMYFVQQFTKQCEARLVRHVLQVDSSQIGQLQHYVLPQDTHNSSRKNINNNHNNYNYCREDVERQQAWDTNVHSIESCASINFSANHELNCVNNSDAGLVSNNQITTRANMCGSEHILPNGPNLYKLENKDNMCGVCGLPLVWMQEQNDKRIADIHNKINQNRDRRSVTINSSRNSDNRSCAEMPCKMDGSLIVRCLRCGHGGHVEHIQEWCNDTTVAGCPRGCNCLCLY